MLNNSRTQECQCLMGRSSSPPWESSTPKMPGSINHAVAPGQQERALTVSPSQAGCKVMVSFLQASPNTQQKIPGKQSLAVTDAPTRVLQLFGGRSTKIKQTQCLSNTDQGQSQQTALVSLRRHRADSPSLPQTDTARIDFGSTACCALSCQ